jgi:hypothetical protein
MSSDESHRKARVPDWFMVEPGTDACCMLGRVLRMRRFWRIGGRVPGRAATSWIKLLEENSHALPILELMQLGGRGE